MNFEEEMKNLVALQAAKIAMEFTIVDFAKMTVEAIDEGKFICKEASEEFLKNLEYNYHEFIGDMAKDMVVELFKKHVNEIVEERELEEVEDLEELEELEEYGEIEPFEEEIEPLEKEEGETDLEYVIKNDIYIKNVNIYNQEKYPESETESYWMLGIDINELTAGELQVLSIIDRDFW